MKAMDFCSYCSVPMWERLEHEGICPTCGDRWDAVVCAECGEMIAERDTVRNDETGDTLCRNCAWDLGIRS
jgi:formylmethanofuran dehydrogenase subunit E